VEKPVQIISGERGVLVDVTPNDSEISAARARLGDNGFIAYYACTLDTVTQAQRAREMSDMAAAFGLAYKVYNANNDAATQAAQLKRAQSDGATAVILCPLDINLLGDTINTLKAANIPLAYLTLVDSGFYGVKQDSNSYSIGQQVGRLAGQIFKQEQPPPANVVLLNMPGSDVGSNRAAGMEDGFRENEPNVTFLGPFDGFTQDDSYASIKKLLQDKTAFNVVLSMTDAGAYGAIKALQEAGFSPNSVIVVSANGESYAQELIREGEFLRGTVEINHQESSQIAIDSIIKMLAGDPVPETISVTPGDILTRDVLIAKGSN
ncbi:MAG TPA: sugar ABC transporter substrate-binding protein, partial [Phototrophicaceae bacterium]|nr:sugar ABC transporter substrate-binding protein [Phototrophicaceae bacterium]